MAMPSCECSETAKRYRHWVTVQSPAGTPDAGGHVDLSLDANWTTEGRIKANFVSKSGREFINAQKVTANHSHTLETRSTDFSRGIETSWRLSFDSRKFQVVSVVDMDEMRSVVRIECTEVK